MTRGREEGGRGGADICFTGRSFHRRTQGSSDNRIDLTINRVLHNTMWDTRDPSTNRYIETYRSQDFTP